MGLFVYVDKKYTHKDVAKSLYACILEILNHQNVKNVYSIITTPNSSSIKLHEFFGFKKLGFYLNCAYKLDEWHNITINGKKFM